MSNSLSLVTIVDYGMGNIRSIEAAINHLGYRSRVSQDRMVISQSEILILPGVGSFPAAMKAIKAMEIDAGIRDAVASGKTKIMGICLGMQLLTEFSSEDGGSPGLSILGGAVERFSRHVAATLPVPHIGFNSVVAPEGSVLFDGLPPETDFYFVHSFRMATGKSSALLATATYGEKFVAGFESGNVFGTQFHPEKSQSNGLRLLANFLGSELT
jgi:glutamine amidotransferase